MKSKTSFVCLECQVQSSRWAGKCANCGAWNSVVELETEPEVRNATPAQIQSIDQLPKKTFARIKTGLTEFDRVLGGDDPGLVPGSVVLLAGSPGVGKSTLLLQAVSKLDNAIYFSAEESLEQLRLRVERLALTKSKLSISTERDLSKILAAISQVSPEVVVIDSIQTIYDETVAGTPGSIIQVKELCWRVQQFAKHHNVTFVLVGHVTKEGSIAGPKVLEHLVDVVLYFEGEQQTGLRVLRSEKNRFGATDEVGIWQLEKRGLVTVDDPGKLFAELVGYDVPGRSLTVALEGSRAFLLEIQALCTKTNYGYPKRAVQGVDLNRLSLLLAVIESRLGINCSSFDVYLNVVGGFYVKDTGIDLAIVAAIVSSITKKNISNKTVLIGEVGLLGEIRQPQNRQSREKEALRLGYDKPIRYSFLGELKKLFV